MNRKLQHSIQDASERCGLPPDRLLRFIAFEWIVPSDRQSALLDEEDLARARLIHELQEEFLVNDEAVPIILRLIDQLHRMHLEWRQK